MPPRAKKIAKKQSDKGRYLVSLRLGHDARVKLEKAAAESGRSLSAEAEARLEWSFRSSERPEAGPLQLRFGRFFGVMLAAGLAADRVGKWQLISKANPGFDAERAVKLLRAIDLSGWVDDPAAYEHAVAAAIEVMETFQPTGEKNDELPPNSSHLAAYGLLRDIPSDPDLAYVRSGLGDLIKRLPRPPTAESAPRSRSNPE
jgi:hypothetical protein